MARRKQSEKNAVEAGETAPPAKRVDEFAPLGTPPGWKSAADTLEYTTAVRTCLPGFNRATRVGGLPNGRIVVLSGATHGGKTVVQLAFAKSYLDAGHFVAYIDAEHALDRLLAERVLGKRLGEFPNFLFDEPANYEATIDKVTSILKWMRGVREKHPEKRLLIIVDSINKLTPKKELDALVAASAKMAESEGEGGEGEKKSGGRGKSERGGDSVNKAWGRMRAAYNQTFLDLMTPLLKAAGATLALVCQEREDSSGEPDYFRDMMDVFQLKGGKAIKYDASLLIRVTKVAPVNEVPGDKKSRVIGWRHGIRIWKSKVGRMDGRWTDCDFHLRTDSTLDTARDALLVGAELGVVAVSGTWYSWDKVRAQGLNSMVRKLDDEPERLAKLLCEVAAAVDAERESEKGVPP